MKRAGCFVLCSYLCSCCHVVVSVLCFFLVVSWVGLCTHLPVEELAALLSVPNCVLAVVWLSVLCVSSWWFYGLA